LIQGMGGGGGGGAHFIALFAVKDAKGTRAATR
jgi:hypothetical protein